MNALKKLQFMSLFFALSSTLLDANAAVAQENFRIPRPTSLNSAQPQHTAGAAPLQATATMDTVEAPTTLYHSLIEGWGAKNLQLVHDEPDPTLAPPEIEPPSHHHGLKSHLGSAVIGLGAIAGTAAGAYVGAPGHHRALWPVLPLPLEPTIELVPGHCPAASDPAFQVPVRWWGVLTEEECSPVLGPQWTSWSDTVKKVFQSRAYKLRATGGVSSLHVMINPNGTIYSITPYNGNERRYGGNPVSKRANDNLARIISEVGNFPPFPAGSRLRCYHLVFCGAASL